MQPSINRRRLLTSLGMGAALAAAPPGLRGATVPAGKLDLLIKGGEVIDPSQSLHAIRDVGIRYGVIAAVEAEIPPQRSLKVIDASGRLVTPGLVDLHAHTFPYGSALGIPADELVPFQGTTTTVSAGCGGEQHRGVPALHRGVDTHAPVCIRAHRQHGTDRIPRAGTLRHRLCTA